MYRNSRISECKLKIYPRKGSWRGIMDAAELKKMTRAELIKAAQNLKISGSGKLKKDELIEAIQSAQASK
ncbi:Rho termination factor N-terminal domain-containing protein, partial [bacterium]|nr:Rho termination factor N-terminal domain-containing protein [bacterium]